MKVCGIIAEYNPFHNGHKYHIEKTKELYGATHIVCVMSGNFTQRGDIAVTDKFTRAQTALKNGADLVIELPVPYALGSAEQFAAGAVKLLDSLGCVDMLSFGSECGDIDLLSETAGAVLYAQQHDDFFLYLREGNSYPAALQKTIDKYYEEDIVDTLMQPNNTLAVEYLKALGEIGSHIEPVTLKRNGAGHDSKETSGAFASASHIRKLMLSDADISAYIPDGTAIPPAMELADIHRLETAILSKLRTLSPEEIEKISNVYLGLENRIYNAVRVSTNLAELYTLVKTKRYTMARIRRIILSAFLDIKKPDAKNSPSYVRILGMGQKGKEILSAAKCELPMDTSLRSLMKKGGKQHRLGSIEARAGDMYALAFEKKRICGLDYTTKPIIIQ